MPKMVDIAGVRFSRLTAVRRVENRGKNIYWLFRCDCGNEVESFVANVKRGASRSCGCYQRETKSEKRRTHGASGSPAYQSWASAKGRCGNPRNAAWPSYGGRGITMDERWLESFEAFLADMGERPEGCTLDRIDNDGPYAPGNCRWATRKQQVANRRTSLLVEHAGQTITLKAFADLMGIGYKRLHWRMRTKGESHVQAAEAMIKVRRTHARWALRSVKAA